eukprot:1943989-Pleurochrysis_carterae.AAC.1
MATAAHDPGIDQPPGLPAAPARDSIPRGKDAIPTRVPDTPKPALASRTVLLIFSGPYQRPDGI